MRLTPKDSANERMEALVIGAAIVFVLMLIGLGTLFALPGIGLALSSP